MGKRIFQVMYALEGIFFVIGFISSVSDIFYNFKIGIEHLGVIFWVICFFLIPTIILQYIIYGSLNPLWVFKKN